jgi:putative ABC transport system permease protein
MILGKPNQFVRAEWTIAGALNGIGSATWFLAVIGVLVAAALAALAFFGSTLFGLRIRSTGERPGLARDVQSSLLSCTIVGLGIANMLAALAGAMFAQRSFSADVNMGAGTTVSGLSAVLLGYVLAGRCERVSVQLACVAVGALLCRCVLFVALEMGVPAQAFRLVSAALLFVLFAATRWSTALSFREIRWR